MHFDDFSDLGASHCFFTHLSKSRFDESTSIYGGDKISRKHVHTLLLAQHNTHTHTHTQHTHAHTEIEHTRTHARLARALSLSPSLSPALLALALSI